MRRKEGKRRQELRKLRQNIQVSACYEYPHIQQCMPFQTILNNLIKTNTTQMKGEPYLGDTSKVGMNGIERIKSINQSEIVLLGFFG